MHTTFHFETIHFVGREEKQTLEKDFWFVKPLADFEGALCDAETGEVYVMTFSRGLSRVHYRVKSGFQMETGRDYVNLVPMKEKEA